MAQNIVKTELHPEGNENTTLYPKTSADQVEGFSEAVQNTVGQLPAGPKGEDGKDGVGISNITSVGTREENGYTVTDLSIELTNGTSKQADVYAKNGENGQNGTNGAPGEKGNGIVSITTIGYTQGTGAYEGYTETNINVDTDDETIPIKVYAKNGENGSGGGGDGKKYYKHTVNLNNPSAFKGSENYPVKVASFEFISSNSTPMDIYNFEDFTYGIMFISPITGSTVLAGTGEEVPIVSFGSLYALRGQMGFFGKYIVNTRDSGDAPIKVVFDNGLYDIIPASTTITDLVQEL